MIINNQDLINRKLLSIQTGRPLGVITELMIDPRDLSIPALFVKERNSKNTNAIIHTEDIRKFALNSLLVNDYEDIMDYEDINNLKEVVDLDFGIIGCRVVTQSGKKLGKVSKVAVYTKESWRVEKIYIEQSLFKNLSDVELAINFSQITQTSKDKITVKDSYSDHRNKRLARSTSTIKAS